MWQNNTTGVLIGVAVTIIPSLFRERGLREQQKEMNRQHVWGLLRLMVLQAENSADNGVLIELEPLEIIFKGEGLYTVLAEKDDLNEPVRELWMAAERHNKGLNQSGGAQRSIELRQAAQRLSSFLEKLS